MLNPSRLSVGRSWGTKAETPCDLGTPRGLRRAVCTLGYTRAGCRAPQGKARQRPPHPRVAQLWPHQCPSGGARVSPLGPSQLPLATCIPASSMPVGSREVAGRDPICQLCSSRLQEGRNRSLSLSSGAKGWGGARCGTEGPWALWLKARRKVTFWDKLWNELRVKQNHALSP